MSIAERKCAGDKEVSGVTGFASWEANGYDFTITKDIVPIRR